MKLTSSQHCVPAKFLSRRKDLQGLVGGGCIFSREKCSWCDTTKFPETIEDLNLGKGPMVKAISRISAGISEQDYLKLYQGLDLIKKVRIEELVDPLIDLTKLIEILNRKYTSGFPQTIQEKIAAIIPYILCFLINNLTESFTDSLKEDLLNKLTDLEDQVNLNHLSGPELQFYYEVSIWFLKAFPTPNETKNALYDIYDTLKDFAAIVMYALNPSEPPTEALSNLGDKFIETVQEDIWDERLVNFFSIQNQVKNLITDPVNMDSVDAIIHLGTSQDHYTTVAALLGLKEILLKNFNFAVFEKSLGFIQEMSFKQSRARPVAMRMCIELASADYMSKDFGLLLSELFNPNGKIMKTDNNLLVRSLIANRVQIKAYLETFEENWLALTGINIKDYNNMMELHRESCSRYTYIRLKVSEQHEKETQFFEDKIEEFLGNKKQNVCLLLGAAGSGKTVLSTMLALRLLETKNDYLPIYVSLPRVKDYIQDLVNVVMGWYRIDPNSVMIRYRRILFILDGYDQLPVFKNIISTNNIHQSFPECKVLITCRTFECPADYYFTRSDISIKEAMKHLCKLYIQPLFPEQIEEFLQLHEKDPKLITNLSDFASNPMVLSLCTSDPIVMGELLNRENPSKIKIYKVFVNKFQQRGLKNIIENPNFEIDHHETQNLITKYTELSINYAMGVLLKKQIDIKKIDKIYLGGLPLGRTENEDVPIEFIHSSIGDYFLGMHLTAVIQSENAVSFLNENDFRYKHNIASFIPEEPLVIESLTNIVKDVKDGLAPSNAISLLNMMGYNFSSQNWKGIQIRGANLSGANLWNTNLSNSDLRDANLKDSRLLMADLSECDLTGADLGLLPSFSTQAPVCSVSFASDYSKIAVGCTNGLVSIWDLLIGCLVYSENTPGEDACVVFSSDCKMLGIANQVTTIWMVSPRENLLEIPETCVINAIDFSTDNKAIASGGEDGTVNVREIATKSLICSCKHTGKVVGVKFNKNLIASASIDGQIMIWNMLGKTLYTLNQSYIKSLSFYGKLLVSAGDSIHIYHQEKLLREITGEYFNFVKISGKWIVAGNDDIKIWEIDSGKLVHVEYIGSPITGIDTSPDGKRIAYGTQNGVKFIETDKFPIQIIKDVKCSEDNKWIVSLDSTIKIWSIERGELAKTIYPNSELEMVSVNVDASLIVGYGENIQIWKQGVLQESLSVPVTKILALTLNEEEEIFICFAEEDNLVLKNISKDTTIMSFQTGPSIIKQVDCLPSILLFAVAYENSLSVYEEKEEIFSQEISVNGLSLSKDGTKLASCGQENMNIWEIRTGELISSIRSGPQFCASLFLNSMFLVTGKSELVVWNTKITSHKFGRAKSAFSEDGQWLAWKTRTEIKVWNQGTHVHSFSFNGDKKSKLAFIDNCICLIDSDNFVKAWKLEDGSPTDIHSIDMSRISNKVPKQLPNIFWRSSKCVYASNIDLAVLSLKNFLVFKENHFLN